MNKPDSIHALEGDSLSLTIESAGIDHLHIVQSAGPHPFDLPEWGSALTGFRPSNRYALSHVQAGGFERYSQHGRNAVLGLGDMVLIDMHASFSRHSGAREGMKNLFFLLDGDMAEKAIPGIDQFMARRISGNQGWGERLSNYLVDLTPARLVELSAHGDAVALLPQQIIELLSNALATIDPQETDRLSLHERAALELRGTAMAWLRENFADPRLNVKFMETSLGTSRRELHYAFSVRDGKVSVLQMLHQLRLLPLLAEQPPVTPGACPEKLPNSSRPIPR